VRLCEHCWLLCSGFNSFVNFCKAVLPVLTASPLKAPLSSVLLIRVISITQLRSAVKRWYKCTISELNITLARKIHQRLSPINRHRYRYIYIYSQMYFHRWMDVCSLSHVHPQMGECLLTVTCISTGGWMSAHCHMYIHRWVNICLLSHVHPQMDGCLLIVTCTLYIHRWVNVCSLSHVHPQVGVCHCRFTLARHLQTLQRYRTTTIS